MDNARRLKKKIADLRKELSKLEAIRKKDKKEAKSSENLERRYNIKVKGLSVVIEEAKQRIIVITSKVSRYQASIDEY